MAAFTETFAQQRRLFPRMALPIIAQAEKGSLPAAVKLTCLECTCWQKKEIRDCEIRRCPLYPHRPFQRLKGRKTNEPPATNSESTTES
jgi:hypothetical protein